MKRIYKVEFRAKWFDTYPKDPKKKPYVYFEDESMSVIAGTDAKRAIELAERKAVGRSSRGSYPDDNDKTVHFVSKCVGFTLTSVTVKAEAEA